MTILVQEGEPEVQTDWEGIEKYEEVGLEEVSEEMEEQWRAKRTVSFNLMMM